MQPAAASAQAAGWLPALETLLGSTIELAATVLLLVEVVVLFSGVVARYLLHHPFVWTDEVDSTLFLWLGMFGAVIALRRSQHMRMTTFVALLPEQVQLYLSSISSCTRRRAKHAVGRTPWNSLSAAGRGWRTREPGMPVCTTSMSFW